MLPQEIIIEKAKSSFGNKGVLTSENGVILPRESETKPEYLPL
jgi:hypothetical protein